MHSISEIKVGDKIRIITLDKSDSSKMNFHNNIALVRGFNGTTAIDISVIEGARKGDSGQFSPSHAWTWEPLIKDWDN